MTLYAQLCGWTLARAHARSGDAIAIAGYLGAGDSFDRALAAFAEAYADQNERDHRAVHDAVASGRSWPRPDSDRPRTACRARRPSPRGDVRSALLRDALAEAHDRRMRGELAGDERLAEPEVGRCAISAGGTKPYSSAIARRRRPS